MKRLTVYSGAIGINNKVAPHRLKYSIENGVSALEQADNIIIDRTGEIVARRGFVRKAEGKFHSLFPGKDWGLVAKDRNDDTAIYRVTISNTGVVSIDGIRDTLTKGKRIDFCQVMNAIFYTNGDQNGMITSDAVSVPWKESQWPNDQSKAVWAIPPPADHLCYNAGRIYFSLDDVLHYTEFGHLGLYDVAIDGEHFPDRIILMVPALDGLYVSTEKAIYFLSGLDPHDWHNKKVFDYPAMEWGKYYGVVDPSFMGFETNVPSSLIATKNGPVLCLPSGQAVNLIDKNVILPECTGDGAISLFDETLIIQTGE